MSNLDVRGDVNVDQKRYPEGFVSGVQTARAARGLPQIGGDSPGAPAPAPSYSPLGTAEVRAEAPGYSRKMPDEGLPSRLSLAFSRHQAMKIYVQDRIREEGEDFFRWLESCADVLVCGDAERMAQMRRSFDVVARHGGKSKGKAKSYVADLGQTGRYHKDVY